MRAPSGQVQKRISCFTALAGLRTLVEGSYSRHLVRQPNHRGIAEWCARYWTALLVPFPCSGCRADRILVSTISVALIKPDFRRAQHAPACHLITEIVEGLRGVRATVRLSGLRALFGLLHDLGADLFEFGIAGLKLERLVQIGHSSLLMIQCLFHHAAIGKRVGALWLEREHEIVVGDGACEVTDPRTNRTAIEVRGRTSIAVR